MIGKEICKTWVQFIVDSCPCTENFFLQFLWFSSLPETLILNPNSTWKNGQKEPTHGILTAKSLFIIIIIIIIIITVILLALIE